METNIFLYLYRVYKKAKKVFRCIPVLLWCMVTVTCSVKSCSYCHNLFIFNNKQNCVNPSWQKYRDQTNAIKPHLFNYKTNAFHMRLLWLGRRPKGSHWTTGYHNRFIRLSIPSVPVKYVFSTEDTTMHDTVIWIKLYL